MSVKLSHSTYRQVIQEDLDALYKHMPDSIERQHIEDVLKYSIEHFYPGFVENKDLESEVAWLRDQIADLERENNNYRLVYDSVVKNRDELRERVKELEFGAQVDSDCIESQGNEIDQLKAKIASYESAIDGLKKVVDSLYNLRS